MYIVEIPIILRVLFVNHFPSDKELNCKSVTKTGNLHCNFNFNANKPGQEKKTLQSNPDKQNYHSNVLHIPTPRETRIFKLIVTKPHRKPKRKKNTSPSKKEKSATQKSGIFQCSSV